jgi:ERF superfamily
VAEEKQEAPQTKNLVQKLCEVGASLSYIEKRGKNSFFVYKYATEADIVSAIRLELYKRNVFLIPDVIENKRELVERKTVKDGKEKITYTALTDMNVLWTWLDGDSGETLPCHVPGCGEDSGDKGCYKAFTGSEKYLLLKTFLIPTYDDPEQLTSADKKALQKRIADEKIAGAEAKKFARQADTPEQAEKELAKSKVVWVSTPDRFHGEFAAVYGYTDGIILFLNDCDAQRFKGPEGIYFKLPIQYLADLRNAVQKEGFTLKEVEG